MYAGLYVAELEVELLQGGALARVERLADVQLDPEVLDGEGDGAGPRQHTSDHAHLPVRAALDLLRAHVQHCVHLKTICHTYTYVTVCIYV